ncbi:MAG: hypothetical protein C4339_04010 [Nitrososphaerota archaeon]
MEGAAAGAAADLVGAALLLRMDWLAIRGYRLIRSPTLVKMAAFFTLLAAGLVGEAASLLSGLNAIRISANLLAALAFVFLGLGYLASLRAGAQLLLPPLLGLNIPEPVLIGLAQALLTYFGSLSALGSFLERRGRSGIASALGLALFPFATFMTLFEPALNPLTPYLHLLGVALLYAASFPRRS